MVAPSADPYSYMLLIDSILLDTPGINDFAGVSFWGLDSRFPDQYLWHLGVGAQGSISSSADLLISFLSHPVLTTDGVTPLDAITVENAVRSAFVVSGGVATLSSFNIPTKYSVDRLIE